MARMGMDVDQVESAGRSLKAAAGEIDGAIGRIDGIVKKLLGTWDGQDAQQFVNEWWPEHKGTLVAVKSSVEGLGQSALNNASEQRDVSGTYGGGGGSNPTPQSPGGGGGGSAPVQGGGSGTPGSTSGELPAGGGREAYIAQIGNPDDHLDGMGAYAGECTSWAAWRRQQLGLPWRINDQAGTGNGGEMASRMGGQVGTSPALGSIVSYGGIPGHVMIIEQINPDGSFRVSEMNTVPVGSKDYLPVLGNVRTDRVWHPNGDGTYTSDRNGEYRAATESLVIAH